ncbi:MAG: tyrosine--tRNA ligase [Victivallales bacterium]|nr:tyrosine--tRNA ligase [Victivallales bacterium]
MTMDVYQVLKDRGFIYQETDGAALHQLLKAEKIRFYIGFDPTGSSLHTGHLLPIMGMRWLQAAGHTPIVLVGGATAQIGDPSGKSEARQMLSKETVAANAAALKEQLARFVDVDNAVFVNNADWFKDMLYIDFLREIGSKFSVNRMLTAESVKMRLETGLSFLEFNYMILQGYDFAVLNKNYHCRAQFGGQDQWGNILCGVDLTRRLNQQEVFGATFPLLLNSNGEKFGKSAGNAVWLDASRTSVFDYYQFWRNCEDGEVERLLNFFTAIPVEETAQLGRLEAPAINRAKEILAYEATRLAHGAAAAGKAYLAAGGKFGFADPEGKIATSSTITGIKPEAALDELPTVRIPASEFHDNAVWAIRLLVLAGFCNSNGEARRLIQGGGAYLGDTRIVSPDVNIPLATFQAGPVLLKAGKKKIKRLVL